MKKFIIIISIGLLVACQSTPNTSPQKAMMPDDFMKVLAWGMSVNDSCYNHELYSLDENVSYSNAMDFIRSTWNYDYNKMNLILLENRDTLNNVSDSRIREGCKNVKPQLAKWVIAYNNVQKQLQRNYDIQKARASAPVINHAPNTAKNTRQCKKIGTLPLNQEIKTFSGSFCPVGWYPAD